MDIALNTATKVAVKTGMRKGVKILLWTCGIVIVLLVVAVLLIWSFLGTVVKQAVETVGSQATGAKVTLDDADIAPLRGYATLTGLTIGNPKGFATDYAIRLGKIHVVLDPSTVMSDTIVIKEVLIDGPEVIYEVDLGGSNIGAIEENVDKFTGGDQPKPDAPPPPAEEAGPGKKIIIEKLTVQQGYVHVAATFLGNNKIGAPLPSITLTDIGKEEQGASYGEVAGEFLDAILGSILSVVSTLGLDKLAEEAGVILKGAAGVVEDGANAINEGLKSIFGK